MQEGYGDMRWVRDSGQNWKNLLAVEVERPCVVRESYVEELPANRSVGGLAVAPLTFENILTSSWSPCVILLSGLPSSESSFHVSAYGQSLHAILEKYEIPGVTSTTLSIFCTHFFTSASSLLQPEKSKSPCANAEETRSGTKDSPGTRIVSRL